MVNFFKHIVLAAVALAVLVLPGTAFGQAACSTSSLNGSYGFAGAGFVPEKIQTSIRFDPISQVGLVTYDGNGSLSVKLVTQYHGATATSTFNGSYQITSDCIGTVKFTNSAGTAVIVWSFVLVTKTEEIETVGLVLQTQSRPMYSIVFDQKKL